MEADDDGTQHLQDPPVRMGGIEVEKGETRREEPEISGPSDQTEAIIGPGQLNRKSFPGNWKFRPAGEEVRSGSGFSTDSLGFKKFDMNFLEIIDSKLKSELRTVDQKTASEVRELWGTVNPSPSCPAASDVMKKINKICHKGLTERGKVFQETVIETLKDIEQVINKRNIKKIIEIAQKHFPENQFVSLAENTKGVYERSNAPRHKYNDRTFEIETSLIKCGSENFSRQAIGLLEIKLDEICLKKYSNKTSSLSRYLNYLAVPVIKWTFTIIGAIVATIILFILGIKS